MRTLELPSGTFYAIERGADDAPLALCLHGFPDHPESFVPLMEVLAEAGYWAVAPYMRGYHPSTLDGPYDVEQLATDAIEMSEALSPRRPVALIGHDWGAAAAYPAIAARPDRFCAAVTMAVPHPLSFLASLRHHPAQLGRSWYMMFFQLPMLPEHLLARRDFALVDWLWRQWSPGFELDSDARQRLKATLAASMPAPIAYYRALTRPIPDAFGRLRSGAAIASNIEVPTLHLHGENDGCIAASATREQEQHFAAAFESRRIANAGHFLHLEQPDAVAQHLVPWLSAYPAATDGSAAERGAL